MGLVYVVSSLALTALLSWLLHLSLYPAGRFDGHQSLLYPPTATDRKTVVVLLPPGGVDMHELAVPWQRLVSLNYEIQFATHDGQPMAESAYCGWLFNMLTATELTRRSVADMLSTAHFVRPL